MIAPPCALLRSGYVPTPSHALVGGCTRDRPPVDFFEQNGAGAEDSESQEKRTKLEGQTGAGMPDEVILDFLVFYASVDACLDSLLLLLLPILLHDK